MTPQQAVACGVAPWMFVANVSADVAAGGAAEAEKIDSFKIQAVQWSEGIASRIRNRCAATFLASVQADVRQAPEAPRVRKAKVSLEERIKASKHTVAREGGNLT